VRLVTWSFSNTCAKWFWTIRSEISSDVAISLLVLPLARSLSEENPTFADEFDSKP
jgi:hypothetical protein